MEKKSNVLVILAYLYLVIPNLIFFIDWCNLPTAIVCSSALIIGLFFAVKNAPKVWMPVTKKDKLFVFLLFLISLVWVYLAGLGGFAYQNSDHAFRNAIYEMLADLNAPIYSGDKMLTYYIGYWLPSTVIAKLFNDVYLGYIFQYIQGVTGVFLFLYFLTLSFKEKRIYPVIIFIFFSGLDILGQFYDKTDFVYKPDLHIEWWAYHQFSSNTTLLFWVYNQAIPCWLLISLILNENNNKNMFFLYVCLFISSPLPALGFLPFLLFFALKNGNYTQKEMFAPSHIKSAIKSACSVQNIISVSVFFPVLGLFLMSNYVAPLVHIGTYAYWDYNISNIKFLDVLIFLSIEIFVYLFCLFPYKKKNIIFWMCVIILFVCPFVRIANNADFEMRVTVPSLFFIYYFIIESILDKQLQKNKFLFAVFIVAFFIGAVTPFNEFYRTFTKTKYTESNIYPVAGIYDSNEHSIFYAPLTPYWKYKENIFHVTYKRYYENLFYKYFAKNNNREIS